MNYVQMNTKSCYLLLVILLTWATFFPTFQSILGSAGSGLVNFPLILICFLFFIFNFSRIVTHSKKNPSFAAIALILLFYIAYFPISLVSGILFSDINLISRDLLDFHRPVLFFLSFITLYVLVTELNNREKVESLLIIFFFIIWILGFLQFIRAPFPILELYTKAGNIRTGRSSVPFINPYDFGLIMSFFMYWFLLQFLHKKRWGLTLFVLATFSVLMTQSRSVLIGSVLTITLILPLLLVWTYLGRIFLGKINGALFKLISFIVITVLIVIISYAVISANFPYLISGIEMLFEGRRINSLSIRQEQFNTALNFANESLFVAFLGNGPAKEVLEFVESIYTFYIFRYGVIGLIVFFFIIISIGLLNAFSKVKQTKEPFYIASAIWLFSILIVSAGNNFTEQVRVSFFYYFILAMMVTPIKKMADKYVK